MCVCLCLCGCVWGVCLCVYSCLRMYVSSEICVCSGLYAFVRLCGCLSSTDLINGSLIGRQAGIISLKAAEVTKLCLGNRDCIPTSHKASANAGCQ